MTFLADKNFPLPALDALRNGGWDVLSIAQECPGISDEDVAALCAEQQRILLTFDKDFGELVSDAGCQQEAESCCFGSHRNRQKGLRSWPWDWSNRRWILVDLSV